MRRPPLPADNRAALVRLVADYSPVLQPPERRVLWRMWGHPALTVIDRLQLSKIARVARDRAAREARHD
jgi:hypothetical protein